MIIINYDNLHFHAIPGDFDKINPIAFGHN